MTAYVPDRAPGSAASFNCLAFAVAVEEERIEILDDDAGKEFGVEPVKNVQRSSKQA